MIYTPLTVQAMKLAYRAHHGQVDKSGIPYIFHPYHLAEQMTDPYCVCVALLHDVVEDTAVTLEELKAIFPKEITDAVALLTHDDSMPYVEYVNRIRENPIARTVKLADLRHNSDPTRLEVVGKGEDALRRYQNKYQQALKILEFKEL